MVERIVSKSNFRAEMVERIVSKSNFPVIVDKTDSVRNKRLFIAVTGIIPLH